MSDKSLTGKQSASVEPTTTNATEKRDLDPRVKMKNREGGVYGLVAVVLDDGFGDE
jgi:hypothetical protein